MGRLMLHDTDIVKDRLTPRQTNTMFFVCCSITILSTVRWFEGKVNKHNLAYLRSSLNGTFIMKYYVSGTSQLKKKV